MMFSFATIALRPPVHVRWSRACAAAILWALAPLILACPAKAQLPSDAMRAAAPVAARNARGDIARFRSRVDAILAGVDARKASWGVLVTDRDTGQTLYELNADRYFEPASVAKIFTTAFALSALGRDYRFRTTLESGSTLGSDGRLSGDLILMGRGDPDLSNRKFPYAGKEDREGAVDIWLTGLADAAVAKGLREVDGDIVADDSYFPYDPYPAEWTVGDLFFGFGAPVSAIAFNDNMVSIRVQPGLEAGDPAVLTIEPAAAANGLDLEIKTVAAGALPDFSVVRQPGANFILVRGSMPLGRGPADLNFAMIEPAQTAAHALKQALEARGVHIVGGIRVQHAAPPERSATGELAPPEASPAPYPSHPLVVAEHISPPLIESIRLTNKISQNLHAELFLRTVAREKMGVGSIDEGLKIENDFLKAAGVADGDVVLSDGSGLARDDVVTPRAMVALLRYALQQPWGADFLSTLPIAGVDGTLRNRMKNTAAAGLMQAKTGSTDRVHALSGYATTRRAEYLVFSIIGNADAQQARDATATIDAIATAMSDTLGVSSSANRK